MTFVDCSVQAKSCKCEPIPGYLLDPSLVHTHTNSVREVKVVNTELIGGLESSSVHSFGSGRPGH